MDHSGLPVGFIEAKPPGRTSLACVGDAWRELCVFFWLTKMFIYKSSVIYRIDALYI